MLTLFDAFQDLCCCVINVAYRRAPEHPFPTPTNDVFAVYDWIYDNQRRLGINGTICLGGTSAGASLALTTLLQRANLGLPLPAALVMVAPAQLDNTLTTENSCEWRRRQYAPWTGVETALSFRQLYLPDGPRRESWVQNPMKVPDEILSKVTLPPTFCLTMECDIFFGEADAFCERLYNKKHFVRELIYEGLPHMALSMGQVFPEVYDKMRDIFMRIFDVDMRVFAGLSWPPQKAALA
ncbi:hypothetical protein PV08_07090 [Exophiala spinifera]|uniref:Alpha/beta hydrolase fold-3 domain-containing protein n=1 Tax=Exophiala spinifera TaxID=91928 RepID=A0A0D2B5W1_9EURO|nr:uncharacterized protein PV08_07090 [Exophiala spinifera]KIW14308.1 hypothetical protein PV08_07090 [Exophiala spinifera]